MKPRKPHDHYSPGEYVYLDPFVFMYQNYARNGWLFM